MTSAKPHLQIAIAIIWRDGKVLCARRRANADHVPDVWEFPGGKCKAVETPENCAQREVWEEVGMEVLCTRAYQPITHEYEKRVVTLQPFDCEIVSGEPQSLGNAEIRWMWPHELRDEDFPAANSELLRAIRNR
jgi:mutator protein MutT